MSEDLREKLWSIAAERPNSQYEAVKCADRLFEIVDTERRRYAIEQLEKLPKLIALIEDQENTPKYLVVDAREIARAIAILDKDLVDSVVRRMRIRLQELRHQRSLRNKPND